MLLNSCSGKKIDSKARLKIYWHPPREELSIDYVKVIKQAHLHPHLQFSSIYFYIYRPGISLELLSYMWNRLFDISTWMLQKASNSVCSEQNLWLSLASKSCSLICYVSENGNIIQTFMQIVKARVILETSFPLILTFNPHCYLFINTCQNLPAYLHLHYHFPVVTNLFFYIIVKVITQNTNLTASSQASTRRLFWLKIQILVHGSPLRYVPLRGMPVAKIVSQFLKRHAPSCYFRIPSTSTWESLPSPHYVLLTLQLSRVSPISVVTWHLFLGSCHWWAWHHKILKVRTLAWICLLLYPQHLANASCPYALQTYLLMQCFIKLFLGRPLEKELCFCPLQCIVGHMHPPVWCVTYKKKTIVRFILDQLISLF